MSAPQSWLGNSSRECLINSDTPQSFSANGRRKDGSVGYRRSHTGRICLNLQQCDMARLHRLHRVGQVNRVPER